MLLVGVGVQRDHAAFAVPQRDLDGIDDAAALRLVVEDEAVDHDLDGVPALPVERDGLVEAAHLSVDADADEASAPGVVEDVLMLALLVDYARGEEHESRALLREHRRRDLLHRLALHGSAAVVAVGVPDAGEQQAQVVVDLGYGADGRSRVVGDALLVDGDGGGEPLDVLDVGLVHAAKELARVCRERFDVPPLTLGVDRIERERRFTGA